MNCSLLDLPCHLQSAALGWWGALGWPVQSLIVLGLVLMVGGSLWSVGQVVKRIGGWPAVGGFVLLVVAAVLALAPKKRQGLSNEQMYPHPDGPILTPRKAKKKPRPTIFDVLKGRRP